MTEQKMPSIEISSVSEILAIVQNFEAKQDPTSTDVLQTIKDIYFTTIFRWQDIFKKMKEVTIEDAEDTSDFVIDVADTFALTIIRRYSLDVMDAPYEMSAVKLNKMKKHLARILITSEEKRELLNEIFSYVFFIAYLTPVQKATDHRGLVLKEQVDKSRN